ncbi:unnamed protein product [Staurois parvus]|uniref:Uncharacterized protein n=1 Tax=Staurois parvus TaxID=386267 RepID=A0ABN9BM97_9NEOB|nr:unnamed protein product [Staurois parvus]
MWQMRFNVDKCKIMHLGAKNMHASYILGGYNWGNQWRRTDHLETWALPEGPGCPWYLFHRLF